MRTTNRIKDAISAFVQLQKRLLERFRATYPDISDWKFLIDAPKQGSIDLDGEFWLFRKHGGGLSFKNWDGVTIDVHRNLSTPNGLDAWRLMHFLESYDSDYQASSENEIVALLEELCKSGELALTDEVGFYRLKS